VVEVRWLASWFPYQFKHIHSRHDLLNHNSTDFFFQISEAGAPKSIFCFWAGEQREKDVKEGLRFGDAAMGPFQGVLCSCFLGPIVPFIRLAL